jgi:hypothetical protein
VTTLHVNPAEPAPYEVRDGQRILVRLYSARAAEAWQANYDRTRRAPDVAPMGLEELGALMERLSRGGK